MGKILTKEEKARKRVVEEVMDMGMVMEDGSYAPIVTEKGDVFALQIHADWGGILNPLEEDDGRYTTMYLSRNEIRGYAEGDKDLTYTEINRLFDGKDAPEVIILPLQCRLPSVSTGHAEIYSLGDDYVWWEAEEDEVSLRREVIGFLVAKKADWVRKTGNTAEKWEDMRGEIILSMEEELKSYNSYLCGEAYGYTLTPWEPMSYGNEAQELKDVKSWADNKKDNPFITGFAPEYLHLMYEQIAEDVGGDWHIYSEEKDDLKHLLKKFRRWSMVCPFCGRVITGYLHDTWQAICPECGTRISASKESIEEKAEESVNAPKHRVENIILGNILLDVIDAHHLLVKEVAKVFKVVPAVINIWCRNGVPTRRVEEVQSFLKSLEKKGWKLK